MSEGADARGGVVQLIPAIDLRGGRVVRLAQGDDRRRTVYEPAPEAVLAGFAVAGIALAHVIDLDAAFGEPPQRDLIARLAARGTPRLELGGGLRDEAAIAWALEAGCERVVLGSMVVRDPDGFSSLARRFPGRLVPALEMAAGALRIAGWKEKVTAAPEELVARLRGLPCPALLVTDIERDGTLRGPNLRLTQDLATATGLPALVSGGVRDLDDLRAAAAVPEIAGAIVGKALYEGRFTLEEALAACRGEGDG